MPKKRAPSMNLELMEYLKFLHIHSLVDIITIIESIPIYYQTQIRNTIKKTNHVEDVIHQKMRLQNLTYIAKHAFNFSFPRFKFDFQTFRMGPFSLDIENELQNLVNSEVFNNAVSSRKQYDKRYRIQSYNKDMIIDMFKGLKNYRSFLETVENRDIFCLRDIALSIFFHNHYTTNKTSKMYKFYTKNDINKYKILYQALKGVVSHKIDSNAYIKDLVDIVLLINLQQEQSLQSLTS